MKQLMKIMLGLVLIVGMGSCSLFDIDVKSTLSGKLDVNVEEQAAKGAAIGYPFQASTTIDPLEDPDVEKYADKITDVGVDGVVAEVESVSKPGVIFYSGCMFSIANGSKSATYTLDEDWPIEVGTQVTLEDLGGFYNDMADILQELDVITLAMSGTSSEQGVTVTIRVDIETTMTGNPF